MSTDLIPLERVMHGIITLREQKVILDADLAKLYGVTTKRLNEAVKRNKERFPPEFMFQLSENEKVEVVANCDHLQRLKFSPVQPYAFTEHGAIMIATVLSSPLAVQMSIFVVKAFLKMRHTLTSHKELAQKVADLERTLTTRLDKHERAILRLLDDMKQLMQPPEPKPKQIGFHVRESNGAPRAMKKKVLRQ